MLNPPNTLTGFTELLTRVLMSLLCRTKRLMASSLVLAFRAKKGFLLGGGGTDPETSSAPNEGRAGQG